ncbi:MAG: hypothetical protein A3J82_02505 [Elusimicrobia bacterium RIFOXYA2_FULL_69_6]|nr:MAG: hypothetical protein A3J82_02505 [Elusimicrobia bacterium RIFOXYA2_FULL_69_6]
MTGSARDSWTRCRLQRSETVTAERPMTKRKSSSSSSTFLTEKGSSSTRAMMRASTARER